MYVCIFTHTHILIYTYIYINVYIYVHKTFGASSVCFGAGVCLGVVFVSVLGFVYMFVYVRMCVCVGIHHRLCQTQNVCWSLCPLACLWGGVCVFVCLYIVCAQVSLFKHKHTKLQQYLQVAVTASNAGNRLSDWAIDWLWLPGWPIHKGAICTRIAPLWIRGSSGVHRTALEQTSLTNSNMHHCRREKAWLGLASRFKFQTSFTRQALILPDGAALFPDSLSAQSAVSSHTAPFLGALWVPLEIWQNWRA